MNYYVPPSPKISRYIEKKYAGYSVVSLDGKIMGIGKNASIAHKKALKKAGDVDKQGFLFSTIHDRKKIYMCLPARLA